METILVIGIVLVFGFVLGELVTLIRLPKVTGFIAAGLLLNPGIFPYIPEQFVEGAQFMINLALAIITFNVGGELKISRLRELGRGMVSIAIFEAETAFLAVTVGVILLVPLLPGMPALEFSALIALALVLASLAAPTDPTATLAVMEEYGADGPVSSTIMGVTALDDSIGIINFSLAGAIGAAIAAHAALSVGNAVIHPLLEIGGGVGLGVVAGLVFNLIIRVLKREGEGTYIVVIVGMLTLFFGIAQWLAVDALLTALVMGVLVTNFCLKGETIFSLLERYIDELIFLIFFTLSGMFLDYSVLTATISLIFVYIPLRFLGKYAGTRVGATLAHAPGEVRHFTAFGLIPQGGIVVGLALMVTHRPAFGGIAQIILATIMGAVIIHELIGPTCSKIALRKAGEITGNGQGQPSSPGEGES